MKLENAKETVTNLKTALTDPLVEAMIEGGETYSLNCDYPVIHTLYLKAESGGSTVVRIYGKQGRQIG